MKQSFLSLILLFLLISCKQHTTEQQLFDKLNLEEIDIISLQERYKSKEISIPDVTEAYLQRIQSIDKNGAALNSIIHINPEAMTIANQLQQELEQGKWRGPMHGIPILIKDNIDTYDLPTTAGSRALKGSIPKKDAFIVKRLRESGAIILGKTNLSEWANFRGEKSTSGWSGLGGLTKNPYYLSRNACGSSSGSGVAVSANLCMVAIGTETNGSVVCPSSTNGIVGIKPTVGLCSRSGIIPISVSQDTPGPMARTVSDAAICLDAILGVDAYDIHSSASKAYSSRNHLSAIQSESFEGKRIGLYMQAMGIDSLVDSIVYQTLNILKEQGAEIVEIRELYDSEVGEWSFNIMLYEYKDGLNKYLAGTQNQRNITDINSLIEFNKQDSVELKYFGQEFLEMAAKMDSLDSEEYQALLLNTRNATRKNGIDKVMLEHNLDAIIAPTNAPAWKTDLENGDTYKLGSSSPAAISGYPNITVPMGNINGLPVGLSFFGRAWTEPELIKMAYNFEQLTQKRIIPQFFESLP